ncbi:MAG: hypothetical protein JNM47_00665 [Hyphomonadaceae bacterium]|nr:hypothetical protein [Hyphomonadaceae bacterium]
MKRTAIAISAILAGLSLAACSAGDAEKAGERADSAYEEMTQGQKDLTDGPLENAGEAVDRAATDAGNTIEREANQAKEDLKNATDGNPKT